jgi:hypothetical protein
VLSCIGAAPQARVLVVGAKRTLDAFTGKQKAGPWTRFEGGKTDPATAPPSGGIVLATPKALDNAPALSNSRWDVLCLLEADSLVRGSASRLAAALFSCQNRLALGLFTGTDFLRRAPAREALSRLFGIPSGADGDLLWRYGLRRPEQPPPALPVPGPRASRSQHGRPR